MYTHVPMCGKRRKKKTYISSEVKVKDVQNKTIPKAADMHTVTKHQTGNTKFRGFFFLPLLETSNKEFQTRHFL